MRGVRRTPPPVYVFPPFPTKQHQRVAPVCPASQRYPQTSSRGRGGTYPAQGNIEYKLKHTSISNARFTLWVWRCQLWCPHQSLSPDLKESLLMRNDQTSAQWHHLQPKPIHVQLQGVRCAGHHVRPQGGISVLVFDWLCDLIWILALCCDTGRGRVWDCFASVFVFQDFAVGAVSALFRPSTCSM